MYECLLPFLASFVPVCILLFLLRTNLHLTLQFGLIYQGFKLIDINMGLKTQVKIKSIWHSLSLGTGIL